MRNDVSDVRGKIRCG